MNYTFLLVGFLPQFVGVEDQKEIRFIKNSVILKFLGF